MSSSSSHIEIHLLTFPHSTSIQYEVVARATIQVRDNSRLGGTVRAIMKRPICKIVRLTLHMALLLSPLGSEEEGRGSKMVRRERRKGRGNANEEETGRSIPYKKHDVK